jgi:predicted TIM-barrel fold metal-dependent hydrolase
VRIETALVDHHVHACSLADLDLSALGGYLSETPNVPADASHLFGPLGLAVRRWCPPTLDLEPFCDWPAYVARRSELGATESSRRLVRAANVSAMLVDTGYRGDELCDLDTLTELSGATTHEILRIETVAEVVRSEVPAIDFWATVEERLRSTTAVSLKSVIAYRCGFHPLETQPDHAALAIAVERWYASGEDRCDDPIVESGLVHLAAQVGAELGLPLQFHVGLGDPDLTLHDVNPTLLTSLIRAHPDCTFALLHCWPFERDAGYLATVFENVVIDVGLALNHVGPSALSVMSRSLELAPFSRILYASDAFGLAELHLAGAEQFRWSLAKLLDGWIADGACTVADADAIVFAISATNAGAVYPRLAD